MAEYDHQAEMERFFLRVGYAITRWAHVDSSLFTLCQYALNTTELKTAIVFHRTPSIGDHLRLTGALMQATDLKPDHLKHWKMIQGAIEKLLPFRNELAHNPPAQVAFMEVRLSKKSAPRTANVRQWWEIQTEPTKLLHPTKSKKGIKATTEQIVEHIRKVDRLQKAMYALQWELTGRPKGLGPGVPAPSFPANLD